MADTPAEGKPPFLRSAPGIALLVFGGVAGFFLVAEHRAHLWGILPFLFLLLCPLMHFFIHSQAGRVSCRCLAAYRGVLRRHRVAFPVCVACGAGSFNELMREAIRHGGRMEETR